MSSIPLSVSTNNNYLSRPSPYSAWLSIPCVVRVWALNPLRALSGSGSHGYFQWNRKAGGGCCCIARAVRAAAVVLRWGLYTRPTPHRKLSSCMHSTPLSCRSKNGVVFLATGWGSGGRERTG